MRAASTVLDIAPQSMIRRVLRQLPATYVGLDIDETLAPTVRGSITNLPIASDSIDVIICMHVLEHIPNDRAAICELARVLSPTGLAFVQVPRKHNEPTDEDPGAPPEERIERFGQHDHVRFYGDDFEQRLRTGGLIASVVTPSRLLTDAEIERFGLLRNEELWICSTSRGPGDAWQSRSDLQTAHSEAQRDYLRLRYNPLVRGAISLSRPLRAIVKRLRR